MGANVEPWSKTCPMYYYRTIFYQSVLSDLGDYKRGALGNVRRLGSAYRRYLQEAENEQKIWETENERQLTKN